MKANSINYIAPEIISTADGSKTLWLKELNETYHSKHGAVQESLHVFIENGLKHCLNTGKRELKIFELGFGTGLNVFLTLKECIQNEDIRVEIHSIEKYPVLPETVAKMEYELLDSLAPQKDFFRVIIECPWNEVVEVLENFMLNKMSKDFFEAEIESDHYDLIYFDAFGARAQAEMWTEKAFEICARIIKPNGILVTYASKGSARRALQKVGFQVEKLPGPPGKREMMRAIFI